MQHQQPVADPIMGFPSPFVIENAVLCAMVHSETVIFPMDYFPCNNESIRKGWQELQESGIRSLVLDPQKYTENDWNEVTSILRQLPIKPIEYEGLQIVEIPIKP